MTNEKMYQYTMSLKKALENEADTCYLMPILEEMRATLEEVMRVKEASKKHGGSRVNILKRFMKDTIRWENEYTPYNDKFLFCDGYRLAILSDSYGYKEAKEPMKGVDDLLRSPRQNAIEIEVDTADLKAYLLREKAEGRGTKKSQYKPYRIETPEFDIGFNPKYLEEMISLMGTAKVRVSSPKAPAYLINEDGEEALLCPIMLR